ncbi:MAG TPA: molybdopterin-dependent oxidoreductase, partial [Burkholderiaceae bacterium]|nr:molybdopterin-dependent oxidoreductase [Burkholderiaceae bacterium]
NRGPFDPVLDQMMSKHGIRFTRAHEFDAAALQRLPAVTIKPTLEYDSKQHTLQGPLLATVLEAAGVARGSAMQLHLRAVDGYNVAISLADANAYRMIVANRIDGQPLSLGGLGPQWALYEADTVAPFKDKPLKERFGLCPWGLYHIDVKAA